MQSHNKHNKKGFLALLLNLNLKNLRFLVSLSYIDDLLYYVILPL